MAINFWLAVKFLPAERASKCLDTVWVVSLLNMFFQLITSHHTVLTAWKSTRNRTANQWIRIVRPYVAIQVAFDICDVVASKGGILESSLLLVHVSHVLLKACGVMSLVFAEVAFKHFFL